MKIHESICVTCKHFWHECNADGDGSCAEYCYHRDEEINDRFYDEDEIFECEGYEKD